MSCGKTNEDFTSSTQPDAINKFVGNYMGEYIETNPKSRMSLNAMQTVITKKTANEVRLVMSVNGIYVALNGVLDNEAVVKIVDSTYFDSSIKSGTVTMKDNKSICIKLMLHDAATSEESEVVYVGKK